ncbi:MAG: transposase family protein [Spirochaetaceae bacterium]|jgi:hypothetical protein|nr:transposase family protein [Spirochaetaceae bacterium]
MEKGKKAEAAKAIRFNGLNEVKPDAVEKMRSILQREYDALHQRGGKPPKLTVKDKLDITLKYLGEYRTMDSIAAEYRVCKGTICLSIQWVENTLKKDFALPEKRVLPGKPGSIQGVGAAAAESSNRPQKKAVQEKKHAEAAGHT